MYNGLGQNTDCRRRIYLCILCTYGTLWFHRNHKSDWSLYRGAAVFFEGTEGCAVRHCSFVRMDNNALFVSGYNRNT